MVPAALDPNAFDVLSFDCYGTLIDWETGILTALRPLLHAASTPLDDDDLLDRYARLEARVEAGPYRPYRAVLARVSADLATELGVVLETGAQRALAASLASWPPFADSREALARLARRYRLAVVSNVDDDLFAATAERLGVRFDHVVTAQQVGAYKPARAMFERARSCFGVPEARWLHVAQSRVHDVVPARALGIASVWVDRRGGRGGGAAGSPAEDTGSKLAVPDLTVPDLATLAELAGV